MPACYQSGAIDEMEQGFRHKHRNKARATFWAGTVALLGALNAQALGPLDGEAGIQWWNTQYAGSLWEGDLDVGSISLHGESWWNKSWGVRGALYNADLDQGDGLRDEQRFSLDIKRRLISPTDNTFFAAGVGWENIRLDTGDSSNGIRLSLDGRVGLAGIVSLYGRAAWLPALSDAGRFSGMSGRELETGVVLDPLPFISLRAGYRSFNLDYEGSNGDGYSRANGVILGAGIHW